MYIYIKQIKSMLLGIAIILICIVFHLFCLEGIITDFIAIIGLIIVFANFKEPEEEVSTDDTKLNEHEYEKEYSIKNEINYENIIIIEGIIKLINENYIIVESKEKKEYKILDCNLNELKDKSYISVVVEIIEEKGDMIITRSKGIILK